MNKQIILLALFAIFAVASATVGYRSPYQAYPYGGYSYGASYAPYRGYQGGVAPAYSSYQPYYQPYYSGYYGPSYGPNYYPYYASRA